MIDDEIDHRCICSFMGYNKIYCPSHRRKIIDNLFVWLSIIAIVLDLIIIIPHL